VFSFSIALAAFSSTCIGARGSTRDLGTTPQHMRKSFIVITICAFCAPTFYFLVRSEHPSNSPSKLGANVKELDEDALVALGADAIPILLEMMKHDDKKRRSAAEVMGRIGPPAMPALIDAAKDKDPKIRFAAVEGLGLLGPAAVPTLVETLNDQDDHVRGRVTGVLGDMGPQAKVAVPAMLQSLRDSDEMTRVWVAIEIIRIDPSTKNSALITVKKLSDSPNNSIRDLAAEALKEFGAEAVPALTKRLRDSNIDVRIQTANSLSALGIDAKDAVPALIEVLQSDQQDANFLIAVADTISSIGPDAKAAVPALTNALRNPDLADAAVDAIGAIGPEAKDAVPAIILWLNDERNHLPWHAVEALGNIGPAAKEARPSLTRLLENDDALLREVAAKSLLKIGAVD
jgi:HEAT repeat protein